MRYRLIIWVYFLIIAGCNQYGKRIAGIPLTDYYNHCDGMVYDFGETITIGDPNDRFMITLPYEWDIHETYNDTLYGMIATNATLSEDNPDAFLLLSVTGYQTNDSLLAYFSHEVTTLKKDKAISILEAGTIETNNIFSYWLKFENIQGEDTIMNIVRYVKSNKNNEIYLIQSSVKKGPDQDEKICILKQLADSFELVE